MKITILIVGSVEFVGATARMEDPSLLLAYAAVVLAWSIKIA
jgi:hypothetical protein